MTVQTRRLVAGLAAGLSACIGAVVLVTARVQYPEMNLVEWRGVPLVTGALLLVAAVGLAAYVGASAAGEEQRHVIDDHDARAAHEAERRRGRSLMAVDVVKVVEAGAGTTREVAEVLGVYEYVAAKMLRRLQDDGRVTREDDRFVAVAAADGERPGPARAARWIDTDA